MPDSMDDHVTGIRQGIHDLLHRHPVLGPILALAGKSPAAAPPSDAAPVSSGADRDLSDELPVVHDIKLPVAKPIELPLSTSKPGVDKPLTKPKSTTRPRALAGGRR